MNLLPANFIVAGTHVFLDVQGCSLRIARAMRDPAAFATVEIAEYELRDVDAALLVFDYLQKNRTRFASVKIV